MPQSIASGVDTTRSKDHLQETGLLYVDFEYLTTVDISLQGDLRQTWITGCCFLPGGDLVLCDYGNHKVKVIDSSSFQVRASTDLPSAPFDVAAVDETQVIVTVPKECKLQYITVLPFLMKSQVQFVNKWCWGVAVTSSFICVMCDRGNNDAEIQVFDARWKLLKRIGINPDGSNSRMFQVGRYITTNKSETKIFATDYETDTVWCFTPEGDVVYQYRNEALRKPRGLFTDDSDNVIVVSWKGDSLRIIPPEGGMHRAVLAAKDGIASPQCTCFRSRDGILAVGTYLKNVILIYKIRT